MDKLYDKITKEMYLLSPVVAVNVTENQLDLITWSKNVKIGLHTICLDTSTMFRTLNYILNKHDFDIKELFEILVYDILYKIIETGAKKVDIFYTEESVADILFTMDEEGKHESEEIYELSKTISNHREYIEMVNYIVSELWDVINNKNILTAIPFKWVDDRCLKILIGVKDETID